MKVQMSGTETECANAVEPRSAHSTSAEPIVNTRTYLGFADGDRVRDRRSGCTGRVRLLMLTAEERAEGCAEAEVVWDGFCSADELDLALEHGLVRLR